MSKAPSLVYVFFYTEEHPNDSQGPVPNTTFLPRYEPTGQS